MEIFKNKNAIVESLDYQIPVTQLKGPRKWRYAIDSYWWEQYISDKKFYSNIKTVRAAETNKLRKKLRNLHAKSQ